MEVSQATAAVHNPVRLAVVPTACCDSESLTMRVKFSVPALRTAPQMWAGEQRFASTTVHH